MALEPGPKGNAVPQTTIADVLAVWEARWSGLGPYIGRTQGACESYKTNAHLMLIESLT